MKKKVLAAVIGVMLTVLACAHQSAAQAAPGVYADANNPSGPPDPEKFDQIWQVDPISGQVSISISFATTPQGGRGPKIPFKLIYNSGSTITLQEVGTYSTGLQELGYSGSSYLTTTLRWAPYPVSTAIAPSGPWVTSGPYFASFGSTIPDSGYNPNDQSYSELGCLIEGPYNFTDEGGDTHDTLLEEYQPSSAKGESGAGLNPVCSNAKSSTAWPSSSTSDGSSMLASDGVVTYPDGTTFTGTVYGSSGYPAHILQDTNGNTASLTVSGAVTTATDALNRTVFSTNIPIGKPGQIPAGSYYVTTPSSSSSGGLSYGVTFLMRSIQSFSMPHPSTQELNCFGVCNAQSSISPTEGSDTFPAVTQVSLPDGASSYQFAYDPTYGTVCKITFPTGGYVRFVWQIRPYSWSPYGEYEAISDIVVTDVYTSTGNGSGATACTEDGTENHWSYDFISQDPPTTPSGNVPQNVYSTVHAPDGSYTQYSYMSRISGSPYSKEACYSHAMSVLGSLPRLGCKPAFTSTYDQGANLRKTVDEIFNFYGLPVNVVTSLYDPASGSQGAVHVQQQVQYVYDTWDNVIEKDESDFYPCSGTPCTIPSAQPTWIRSTFTTYPSINSAMYNAHIVNKPLQVAVTNGVGSNGSGTIPASTTPTSLAAYAYDTRGNLTSETKCISISGTGPSAVCALSWSTAYYYDSTGQLTCKIEGPALGSNKVGSCPAAGLATTSYTWSGQANGYLYTVTHPNSATDTYTYFESTTGQVETHHDWNNNQTTYDYTDPLNRIRTITAPATVDGTTGAPGQGVTTYSYTDTPGAFSVQEQHLLTAGFSTSSTTYFDGLGRKVTTKTVSPSCTNPIEADTTYDSMSRVYTVSNPYCTVTDPTYGLTTFAYDALGRKTQITYPDSAIGTITYGGNATEFTDPPNSAGNPQHVQQVNGLSQLTNVCEVSASQFGLVSPSSCGLNVNGVGYLTSYTYDPMGDLLGVNQHSISRSFIYDSLSRLTSATNPETGTDLYVYSTPSAACSPDSTVPCSKTDGRGVVTKYGYDSLSRLVSKTYPTNIGSTPIACFQYDASAVTGAGGNLMGRLTNAWTQAASPNTCASAPNTFVTLKSYLSYDAVGRPLSVQQQSCVAGNCTTTTAPQSYKIGSSYDLAGNTTTLSNPVGAAGQPLTLTNRFDSMSRPCLTTSNWTANASPNLFQVNPTPSSTNPGYSPANGLQNFYLGSTSSTTSTGCSSAPSSPINEVLGYSKRFWVNSITANGQIP